VDKQYFVDFVNAAINGGSRLYIVFSPLYMNIPENEPSTDTIKSMALQYGVPFLDYSQDPTFLANPGYFSDPTHLNNEGAKLFSQMVAARIDEDLDLQH
jgi:lysophospholipase L1-like esterase